MQEAADAFFSGDVDVDLLVASQQREPAPADFAKLDAWFDRYADAGERDLMLDAGIRQFYAELGADIQDVVVLVISWKMEASEMCVYTREEWRRGMIAMDVWSTRQLRQQLDTLRAQVSDRRSSVFHAFYLFCFDYAKERGKKSIELDVGLAVWDIVLGESEFPLLKEFSEYLRNANIPVITKDMWAQTLAFLCQVDTDLSNFDESDAWPVVMDEFVEMKLASISTSKATRSEPAVP